MSFQTFRHIGPETNKGAALQQLAKSSAGANELATLRLTGNVVDGQILTIGGKRFFLKQFNTAGGTLGNAALGNTSPGRINGVTITAHGFVANQLFRVNTEYFRVIRVADADTVDVERGFVGSTVASQASGQSVLKTANYTNIVLGIDKILPVAATLTAAAAGPLIATALNAYAEFGITAEYLTTPTHVLMKRVAQGNTLELTENFTNATVDATFRAGVEKGEVEASMFSRVPTAQEVTDDYMHFYFPFPVKDVAVRVRTTTTRAIIVWDGAITFSADFKRVTLGNGGATDWTTATTVSVQAYG